MWPHEYTTNIIVLFSCGSYVITEMDETHIHIFKKCMSDQWIYSSCAYCYALFQYANMIYWSHTWVRYPGFSGHGVKCPILTTVVPGCSGDLIGCTIRGKWGSFGDLYLARKNRLCVWNKLFLAEVKFSQRRTRPVKSLWWQIVHMQESTNEWKI